MSTPKNTPEMAAVIQKAERLFRAPFPADFHCKAGEESRYLYLQIGSMPTSTHGDASLITWAFVSSTGRAPAVIHPSRGHSYRVMHRWTEYLCRVTNPYDHRNGVSMEIRP